MRDPMLREILDKLRRGDTLHGQDGNYSIQSGCVMRGLRVYIPSIFRPAILQELHAGHLGIVKVKALARGLVYWPNIDHDIENMCRSCAACATYKGRATQTTTHYWEYPARPWERLHMDFAFYGGKTYLLIVDAHSKWPEIFITKDMNSHTVINVLEALFSRFGLPLTVVSDNQPSLVSREMHEFYKQHGVRHITSPPYHAASNGQCERFVSSMKQCLRTLAGTSGTPQQKLNKFLAAYRRAPHVTTGVSPASLFLKRELRSLLDLGRPNFTTDYENKIRGSRVFVKSQVFEEGQEVAIRSFSNPLKKWIFGTIVSRDGDLQYTILAEGELQRRHSNQIRPVSVASTPVVHIAREIPTDPPNKQATSPMPHAYALPPDPVVTPSTSRQSMGDPADASPGTSASFTEPSASSTVESAASPPIALRRQRRLVKQPARYPQ